VASDNDIDKVEIGKLIQAVEMLSKEVDTLTCRIRDLESQLNKGKGVLIGIFLVASGFCAAVSTIFGKWFGG